MSTRVRMTFLALVTQILALTACATGPATSPLADDWRNTPDRHWPGGDWYANRVQDWRVHDGRLECLASGPATPIRTVHLLTRRVLPHGDEPVAIRVRISPAAGAASLAGDGCAGFLFGAGNEQTDYRLTALVHNTPAAGGGMLALAGGDGRVRLLDFSGAAAETDRWTIGRRLDLAKLPVLAAGGAPAAAPSGPIELQLLFAGSETAGALTFQSVSRGAVLSSLTVANFMRARLAGGVALVSHLGPEGSAHGFAFERFSIDGAAAFPGRAFGPVLGVLYTLADEGAAGHTLRLTAQLPVLGDADPRDGRLEVGNADGSWHTAATAAWMDDSFTLTFRIPQWDASRAHPFRVVYAGGSLPGTIRAAPLAGADVVLASMGGVKNFTGGLRWDHDGMWFPHRDLVERVRAHDPDLLFFWGDQIYEGDVSPPDWSNERNTLLDYHTKWQRFLWSFGDLVRNAPAVAIPDDHDVFHGNIWGAGGIRAEKRGDLTAQDSGGYRLPARTVNAIHRTQTSHLPPPVIAGPIGQGIYPYTTRLVYGGLDCAILADRMWKDSPSVMVPAGKVRNGFFQVAGFLPAAADVAGAELLGPQQEAFLEEWAGDAREGASIRLVLSQTPFTCVHTLPTPARSDAVIPGLKVPAPGEYPADDVPVLDGDSNGWPQSARNRALRSIRRAGALHLMGDQHLASVIRYGIDEFRDGPVAFCAPAVANTWPRRWMPREPGANQAAGAPRYTGDYLDGFGNRITVLAVANPQVTGRQPAGLFDRSPGYGIVRFSRTNSCYTLEAWPRWADPHDPAQMFADWPLTFPLAP